ncbi:MAG TPA: DinB family protein [Blastocatellia bacterium]|nr:DinB family protein [Blastocatellia bacterium]
MKRSDIIIMPEYFEKYINQVDDLELPQAFDESIKQLGRLDKNLLAKLDGKRYAPDKWTAKETFQHLIDWERILSFRTLLFARKDGSIPQSVDGDLLAANMNADQRALDSLIDELKITRLSTKALFESFDEDTLKITGTNWKYEISVLAMGFTIIGHQIHHLNILEEKYYPLIQQPG